VNLKTIAYGLLVFCVAILPASADLKQREWNIDGASRQALISIPATIPADGCPLIFAFHGHGGSALNAARTFHYQDVWPEAAVVYMQGLPTPGLLTDPEGKKNGWDAKTIGPNNRDLKFFDAVLASMQKDYKIDPKRVYCTGHSNGGGFTYMLWSQRGDVFAAIAPSAAASVQVLGKLTPMPILHVAGQNDHLVKYEWQQMTMKAVRKINGCSETGTPWASSGPLTGTIYPSPSGTPLVTLIHPGTNVFPPETPALIVRFFKEHVRK